MEFEETPLSGLFLVHSTVHADTRGAFMRSFCQKSFADMDLTFTPSQWSLSQNHKSGTVRGLHLQGRTGEDTKLVRCVSGKIYDVAVDIRKHSSTFGKWFATILEENDGIALYIPEGFAHGFQTLVDITTVSYAISPDYTPNMALGINWSDPDLAIDWPSTPPSVLSERDAALPSLGTYITQLDHPVD